MWVGSASGYTTAKRRHKTGVCRAGLGSRCVGIGTHQQSGIRAAACTEEFEGDRTRDTVFSVWLKVKTRGSKYDKRWRKVVMVVIYTG